MRRTLLCGATLAAILSVGTAEARAQQNPARGAQIQDALPPSTKAEVFVVTPDGRRTYYVDDAGDVWLFNRLQKSTARIATGRAWDLNVAATRDAIAYTKQGDKRTNESVWVTPLDPGTGLPSGAERRLTTRDGDIPAISPDGKTVAFARDDTTGVGQSVVLVPIAGGTARVLLAALPTGVGSIRWTPDGRTLYVGVNPPVQCVPGWSCLALAPQLRQPPGSIHRVDVASGAAMTVTSAGGVLPGLSPDGATLAWLDTGSVRRWIIADANGRARDTLALPSVQSLTGWLDGSTALSTISRGSLRRLRLLNINDRQPHALVDAAENVSGMAWSPDSKTIALAMRGASGEIRVLNADGSIRKTLTIADALASAIAWSPDGRWIAYLGVGDNGPTHIAAIEVASGKTRELSAIANPQINTTIRWAGASALLVINVLGGTGAERHATIRKIDLDGKVTALRDITLGPTPSTAVPLDATSVLVLRAATADLRRVPLTGDTPEHVVLSGLTGRMSAPTLSPDGQWIAVRRATSGAPAGQFNVIELARADGTSQSTVQLPFTLANSLPQIVRGGTDLVVAEGRPQSGEPGVYLVHVATQQETRLFSYSAQVPAPELVLSPDGRTLLYSQWEMVESAVVSVNLASRKTPKR